MNHFPDATKMVSDTPRTDDQECDMFVGVSTFTPEDVQQAFDFARQLECELNAANAKIKLLEEAGDALKAAGYFGGFNDAVDKWIKVKEAKP